MASQLVDAILFVLVFLKVLWFFSGNSDQPAELHSNDLFSNERRILRRFFTALGTWR